MPSPLWLVIGCPLEWCAAHTKCPPGKYTQTAGSVISQPECQTCDTGFFKASTSTNSTEQDSCTAHTKCPPGKYTTAAGSITAQPKCETCETGFYKAYPSRSSMCVGAASPAGRCATSFGDLLFMKSFTIRLQERCMP